MWDLGGHLDFTRRARAGTLSGRFKAATLGVAAVGALPLYFRVELGLARGKYLPAGLHAVEASYVFASSPSAFRAAIVRSVWSSKMPFANTQVVLNLLDGPVDVNLAFQKCLDQVSPDAEVSGLPTSGGFSHSPHAEFGCSWGAPGHGLVHLLLIFCC